ncbi:hypothetical protein ACLBWZ_03380 [Brucellaceae bacterium C25G]
MSYVRGLRPDYMVGTITLVSGSVDFTTVGASLLSSSISQGDTIMTESGRVLIIDEISNDNAGKLAYACPTDAAGVNRPLRIRFQPSGSGSQGAQRDLAARWSKTGNVDAFAALEGIFGGVPVFTEFGMEVIPLEDISIDDPKGNLKSLAALNSAENLMSFFTGEGASGLTPLTEFARTLLDDDNADAALTTLGFSEFMRSLRDDSDENEVLTTLGFSEFMRNFRVNTDARGARNALGLTGNDIAKSSLESFGSYNQQSSNVNLNDAPAGSRGLYNGLLVGSPSVTGIGWWWIETQATYSGSARRQIATPYQSALGGEPIIAVRISSASGVWGEWRYLSGEKGSNANGEFTKFPDGTLICKTNALSVGNFVQSGSVFRTAEVIWPFPVNFVGAAPSISGNSVGSSSIWVASTTIQAVARGFFPTVLATAGWTLSLTATGRWY